MDATRGRGRARAAASPLDEPGVVVKRHSIATRITHWVGALAIVVLVMSGLAIFNAAPYLDASDLSDPAHRILSIDANTSDPAKPVGTVRLFGWHFVTTHVLGYTNDGQDGESARAFPGWITLPGYQDLADARRWHLFFSWIMVVVGAVYFVAGVIRKDLALIVLRPADIPKMLPMQLYYFGLREDPPEHGKYNPLQKAGYTVILFVIAPLLVLSGLALSPGVDAFSGPLTTILGGRQFARTWHFLAMLAIVGFTIGHVGLVIGTGFLNNMRSMTLGTYRLGKNEGTGP